MNKTNEFYLNSTEGTLFYIPPTDSKIEDMYLVLPQVEHLQVVSETYAEPVHDIVFKNLNYMHTTWNQPSTHLGYVDQQTSAYIGENKSYLTSHVASRPYWYQIPASVQVSAAQDITFTNSSMTAVMGGFGVGNDADAHASGIGLGAQNIEISGMYIHETGTNAITMGRIQADGHHPPQPSMKVANNLITENIITRNGRTHVSAAGILATYNDGTEISHNDIFEVSYSGICWGYGWGSNDAGGRHEYETRGLYEYQPRYTTPTSLGNGLIAKNLVHMFGLAINDLGGIYPLSDSPNTNITGNFVFDSRGSAIYHDEGSRSYVSTYNVFNVSGSVEYGGGGDWLSRNERTNYTTGNLAAYNIAVAEGMALQNGTNQWGDNVFNITHYASLESLSADFKKVVYEAGISSSQRGDRPVSFHPKAP